MTITRVECPECGAGLKSPTGFTAGESVACPKCETYFTVEEPDDAEELPAKAKKPVKAVASRVADDDDRPKKKKKKRRDDDDDDDDDKKSYKNSPMRFVILGVLVVVMVVLGVVLILKKQKEKEEAAAPAPDGATPAVGVRPAPGGPVLPKLIPNGGGPGDPFPKGGGVPIGPPGVGGADPFGGLLGTPPDLAKIQADLSRKLIGAWEGTAADGSVHKVIYQASDYTHEVSGAGKGSASGGTWRVVGLVGTKGLKLYRGAGNPIKVVFEDDELIHDLVDGGGKPVGAVVLRKK